MLKQVAWSQASCESAFRPIPYSSSLTLFASHLNDKAREPGGGAMRASKSELEARIVSTRLALYRSLDDHGAMPAALAQLCETVGADDVLLNVPSTVQGANLFETVIAHSLDLDYLTKLSQELKTQDPWSVAYLDRFGWSMGRIVLGKELCSSIMLKSSNWWPYVEEMQLKDVMLGTFNASAHEYTTQQPGNATFHRYGRADQFDQQAKSIFADLIQDIRRVTFIAHRLGAGALHARLRGDALNALPDGVMICDRDGKVLFANKVASTLLSAKNRLPLSNGVLTLDISAQKKINKAIHTALSSAGGGEVILARESDSPLVLTVSPLADETAEENGYANNTVLIIVRDPERIKDLKNTTLVALYSLTPSEAAVAIAVAQGRSTEQISISRKVSIETIRKQIKQAMEKTGSNSRLELAVRVNGAACS